MKRALRSGVIGARVDYDHDDRGARELTSAFHTGTCSSCSWAIHACTAVGSSGVLQHISTALEQRFTKKKRKFLTALTHHGVLQCIQLFFFSKTLFSVCRFLVRLSSNFQERLLIPSSMPQFIFGCLFLV